MAYGDKPFGIRDVKLTDITGVTQVDLPASRTLSLSMRTRSGELTGDDSLLSVVGILEGVEWSLEAGGISLEAWALITGATVVVTSTTPTEVSTLQLDAGQNFPYIKVYGKAVGDISTDDIHIKMSKCKITSLEGSFGEGEFFVTSCSGLAVDDGSNGIIEIVQNETAAALPAS